MEKLLGISIENDPREKGTDPSNNFGKHCALHYLRL